MNAAFFFLKRSAEPAGETVAADEQHDIPPPNSWHAIKLRALMEYEVGHYTEAMAHFSTAANLGDAHSAEILTLMYRLGHRRYGDQVAINPELASYWEAKAAEAASR